MVDFRWMRAIDRLLCLDGALTLLLAGDSQVVASTNSTRSRSRRVSWHEYERLRSTWRNDDDELLFFFCGVSRRNNALGDWLISVLRWHTHTHTYYVSSAVEHDWKYSSVCNGDTRNAQKLEERKSCAMRGPNPVTSRNEMSRPEYLYRLCGLCVCMDGPCTVPHSSFSSLSPDENMAGADYLADANDRSREPASRVKELLLRGGKKRVSRHLPSRRRRRDTLCPIVSVSLNSITLVELLVSISFFFTFKLLLFRLYSLSESEGIWKRAAAGQCRWRGKIVVV